MSLPTPILPLSEGHASQPLEVREFCAARGLEPYVPVLLSLVRGSFDVVSPMRLILEQDAETGQRWVEVAVAVRGEPARVLEAYDRFTDRWLGAAPDGVREHFRLAWHLA